MGIYIYITLWDIGWDSSNKSKGYTTQRQYRSMTWDTTI